MLLAMRSDEVLLAEVRDDPEAFAVFYRRHERTVLGYFLHHVRDPHTSADLTAETFAASLVAARRFRPGPEPALAWLMAIARNKLMTFWRKGAVEARARRRLGLERVALEDESLRRVEEQLDAGGLDLEELLSVLPPSEREAVQARVIEERPYAQLAERLGCSNDSARQRVSRGLATLRNHLFNHNEGVR